MLEPGDLPGFGNLRASARWTSAQGRGERGYAVRAVTGLNPVTSDGFGAPTRRGTPQSSTLRGPLGRPWPSRE